MNILFLAIFGDFFKSLDFFLLDSFCCACNETEIDLKNGKNGDARALFKVFFSTKKISRFFQFSK